MKHSNDKSLTEIVANIAERNKNSINNIVPIAENIEWKKIKAFSYQEIISLSPPPMENIIHPWLPKQGIAFIYAATGVGKTLFTLNVAYAIAAGGNFLKYAVPVPRKVLYVDGEMALNQIHSRIIQIISQQGELSFKDNFYLLNPEKLPNHLMPKINTIEGQEFYKNIMSQCSAEVIVFDNLSSLCSIDENISEQWSIVQNYFISLRSLGKSIIVVHHSGKDTKGYRGTSRMLDIADTAISLQIIDKNEMESENTDSKKFKITYQKARTFGGSDAMDFEVTLSRIGWEFQSIEKSTTERIIEMLKYKMNANKIACELGLSLSYVYRIIRKASKNGLIITE